MHRHAIRALALLLLAVALVAPAPTAQRARAATPDTVVFWNEVAANAIVPTSGTSALVRLAIVHTAIYDAVNAIAGGYEPYLASPAANGTDSQDAAAAQAAYDILVWMLPAQQATFDAALATSLGGVTAGAAKDGGIAVGHAAATQTKGASQGRPLGGTRRFTVPGLGGWVPGATGNDPNAWIMDITPFVIRNTSQFASDGPNPITSREYAEDFAEVKAYGVATNSARTPDQTHQALFWADNAFGMWSRIFRQLATNNALTTAQNARLFAMLYTTAADSQITVWTDKERYGLWRPQTAIRAAASDGNPLTEADESWTSLIPAPPYPDHPSGHNAVSGSIVQTLQRFFGTDKMSFSATHSVSGATRSFTRFSQAIKEILDARVYSGIHFRVADTQGYVIGRQVAHWVGKHAFRPVD